MFIVKGPTALVPQHGRSPIVIIIVLVIVIVIVIIIVIDIVKVNFLDYKNEL